MEATKLEDLLKLIEPLGQRGEAPGSGIELVVYLEDERVPADEMRWFLQFIIEVDARLHKGKDPFKPRGVYVAQGEVYSEVVDEG